MRGYDEASSSVRLPDRIRAGAPTSRTHYQVRKGAERGLASSRSSVQSKAGTVSVYDFSSEGAKGSRLIAALLLSDESIWFVKMLGEEAALASARPQFMHFLESLGFYAAN